MMRAASIFLGLMLSAAAHASALSWTLVHPRKSDFAFGYFQEKNGNLFALPGVSVSTDGGRTWTDRDATVHDFEGHIAFATPSDGVAASFPHGDGLFVTGDGGRSWEPLREPESPESPSFGFFDLENGFALGGNDFFVTRDAGKSWKKSTAISLRSGESGPIDPRAVFVLDARHAWIGISPAVRVVRTEDGGKTWESTEIPGPTNAWALCFSDVRHGWMLAGQPSPSEAALLSTRDGGRTWAKSGLDSARASKLKSLACRDENTVWAAGPGTFLSSADAGTTWTAMAPPGGEDVEDVGILFQRGKDAGSLLFATYESKRLASGGVDRPDFDVRGAIYRLDLPPAVKK